MKLISKIVFKFLGKKKKSLPTDLASKRNLIRKVSCLGLDHEVVLCSLLGLLPLPSTAGSVELQKSAGGEVRVTRMN